VIRHDLLGVGSGRLHATLAEPDSNRVPDLETRSRGNVALALVEHESLSVLVGTFVLVR
jgi:hypothetical protein